MKATDNQVLAYNIALRTADIMSIRLKNTLVKAAFLTFIAGSSALCIYWIVGIIRIIASL